MKTLILLAENQGANWSLIWSDISLFVCVLLLGLAVYLWHKQRKQRENYLVKSTARLCALESARLEILEKFRLYKNDVTAELIARQSRINELEEKVQKRNTDGTFATKSGKGHGKKRKDWTKASKEELLAEAKKRYPVGTIFEVPQTGSIQIIKSHDEYVNTFVDGALNFLTTTPSEGCMGASVFNNGKWAKIVKP